MDVIQRAIVRVKGFVMRWSGGRSWSWGGLARTRIDYGGQVTPGTNSIVASCVLFLARTFPEAPVRVRLRRRNGDLETQPDHPLVALLRRPNPYYAGELLWQATLTDYILAGNAYWVKVRSAAGRVVELWWLPARQVEPRFPEDGSRFIDHYEYNPNGQAQRLRPEDVVHFRHGLDPDNPRKGLSPLASLMREIFTDDEASNFTASLLRNFGVPGVVISPDEEDVNPSQEDLDHVKSEFAARFGGDNRGSVLVMKGKTRVTVLSFSPEQMNLRSLRQIPEERVSAVLGLPAAVIGLGTGLSNTKVGATMSEFREQAYEGNLIPTQRVFAAELNAQLLPDFGDPARLEVDFDLSQVRVLQDDQDALWTRLNVGVQGGWLSPNEARTRAGLDPLPDGDVLYVPTDVTPTDPAALIPPEPAPAPLAEPAPLRALPPGKSRLQRKAAGENLAEALQRVRRRHQAPFENDLDNHLRSQRARVVEALNRQQKAISPRDVFDAVAEATGLQRVLERWYRRVLLSVHALTEDALSTSFDLDDPTTRAFLAEAGKEIAGITAYTRDAIAAALQEGQAAGEGVPQLARRIEALTAFARARATTVATTELAHATNLAAVTSYRASGVVVGVHVFDGDGCGLMSHDDPRKADGLKLRLEEMAGVPTLAHPNCRRAFGAIVDASELEGAA